MATTLLSDDFTGLVIDTTKWTKTDPDGYLSQNNALNISQPHAKSTAFFDDILKSIPSVTNAASDITVQSNLTWTTSSGIESSGGLFLYVDNNNWALLGTRTVAGGLYRLTIKQANVTVYDIDTTQAKAQDVKIEYNFAGGTVKFYYWSGAAWTQLGTTQTFTLGNTAYILFSAADSTSNTGANPIIFDNAYLVDGTYTTQFPPSIGGFLDLTSKMW